MNSENDQEAAAQRLRPYNRFMGMVAGAFLGLGVALLILSIFAPTEPGIGIAVFLFVGTVIGAWLGRRFPIVAEPLFWLLSLLGL